MKLIRSFFLAFALVAAVSHGTSFAESSAIRLLIQKAHSLEGRGRYDLAAQVWQQVLTTDPTQLDALAGLARDAKQTGKNKEAEAYLERLRKLDPHNPELGEIESLRSSSDERSRLDEAVRLTAQHQPDQAMRIYHEVFGDNPPPGGWAIAYYETEASLPGGWEKATSALQHLCDEYPAVSEYKLSLGQLLTYRPATRQRGLTLLESIQGPLGGRARQAWRQALLWEKVNPAFVPSLRAYLSRYHDSDLEAILRNLSAEAQQPEVNRATPQGREEQRGYEALNGGQVDEARKIFEAVLKGYPASGPALVGMGFVQMKRQDFAAAVASFEKAKQVSPRDKNVAEGLETARFWKDMKDGAKALNSGDLDAAVASFKTALSIRPNSPEALQALAGTLLKRKDPSQAVPLYQQLVQLQPNEPENWHQLVTAKFGAEGPDAALTVRRSIPDTVQVKLNADPNFIALSGSIYAAAGQDALAQNALKKLLNTQEPEAGEAATRLKIQIAGLMLRYKRADEAAQSMFQVVDADPNDLDAWQVLLGALVQSHKEKKAAEVVQRIPSDVYDTGLTRPDFLRSVAAIDAANGKLDDAEQALLKLQESEKAKNSADLAGTELQLANVYRKQGRSGQAEELLNSLTDSNSDNLDVWKGYTALLHEKHRDAEAIALKQRMPRKVAGRLMADDEYVAMLAAAQSAAGNSDAAFRLLHEAIGKVKSSGQVVPVNLELQLAWMLLDSPQNQGELFSILERAQTRTDLTASQSREVADLWATWMLRSADAASATGDVQRAVSILGLGCRMLPNDDRLKRSLAGYLLKAGDTRRALNVYKNWGLKGATASDYAGAISAAMNQRDTTYSTAWLQQGLAKWPKDSQLLDLAGKQAAASGDYKKAKLYWREALQSLPAPAPDEVTAGGLVPAVGANSSEQLRNLLVGNDMQTGDSITDNPVEDMRLASTTGPDLLRRLPPEPGQEADDLRGLPKTRAFASQLVSPKHDSALAETSAQRSGAAAIQDQLVSIEGRNTPYLGTGDTVQGRSGQPGFDRMLLEQAEMEASTTIGDQVRVAVLAKPTYVQSGTGTVVGNEQFGTLGKGAVVPMQTASGLAAEGQISSQSFGLRLGTTPEGFLVHNFIGGVRLTPVNGPITFMFDRDSIRDSLLAFSGTRDPGTNTLWGGVVANTASVRGNWGSDHSGAYISAGYQWITGLNVERNRQINGNLGTYWRAYTRKEGSLTIGMNFSAMHYDKNLRYFTLGQGGYFSPQQYFLFSVPVRWTGTYKQRLQYTLAGSLGSQHFEEDPSPYFPTMPALQAVSGQSYAGIASTGANYSVEARMTYQISPNWFLGAWATGNNTRNYASQSAGIFVKYSFEPRPIGGDSYNIPSVPDWKGQQPFRLF